MSEKITVYSFLPWLRQGIGTSLQEPDSPSNTQPRATIQVKLKVTGEGRDGAVAPQPIEHDIQVYGPGDVLGIDSRAIIKVEPRNWITNFEPNYLPYIEFYEEDYPWRYTPAKADQTTHRLRPWIMLVVLKEEEFEPGGNIKGRPLPYIELTGDPNTCFPPADQLWAWAHVHINRDLLPTTDGRVASLSASEVSTVVLPGLEALLAENPDLAYSRIISPRKLEPNVGYHAFLMPSFENGRLAGLGREPKAAATASAWATDGSRDNDEPKCFPYYYRWYFRTGTVGDFEYLVRLLEPKPVDRRVGQRAMDVQTPHPGLTGITGPDGDGVLQLGGALRIPRKALSCADQKEAQRHDEWGHPYPQVPFQKQLAAFINLANGYTKEPPKQAHERGELGGLKPEDEDADDPMITPPLYGRWPSRTSRLLFDTSGQPLPMSENWVHELNLDPRFRVPAGFGTGVVQKNQEQYMDAAWGQIGNVLEANRKLRQAQLALAISRVWYEREVLPLHRSRPEQALLFTGAMHTRVVADGVTVRHQVNTSAVSRAITSTAARRLLRPRGRLMQALPFDEAVRPDNLMARMNAGEVKAAPPKTAPKGVLTVNGVADAVLPRGAPSWLANWLRRYPWLPYVPLLAALIIGVLLLIFRPTGVLLGLGLAGVAAAAAFYRLLVSWRTRIARGDLLREDNQTPEAVERLAKSPDFVITRRGDTFKPTQGTTDSSEAVQFKNALREVYGVIQASRRAASLPPRRTLDIPALAATMVGAINPTRTIPRRVLHSIVVAGPIRRRKADSLDQIWAYPELDIPMYKPLVDISADLFLPNINHVSQNSISLLETNQRFIESYLVGLNHEFARELLWREYPTDQRGSYFRQFWDVRSYLDPTKPDAKTLRDNLKDIPPLHQWPKDSALGTHNQRAPSATVEEKVVLVIRGELLKKYPTAVIYAHRADWAKDDYGQVHPDLPRNLVPVTGDPSPNDVKTPLYEAKVEPDIYFFGFDLTVEQAKGDTWKDATSKAGWFFVIQERAGEPRFGLDISPEVSRHVWNELAWGDVWSAASGDFLQLGAATPTLGLTPLSEPILAGDYDGQMEKAQHLEDEQIMWSAVTNSADLAYILYQVPVMVAVHASDMLPEPTA